MRLTFDGTDKLNFLERPHQDRRGRSIRRANQMSISLTEVTKPFNAINNMSQAVTRPAIQIVGSPLKPTLLNMRHYQERH